MGMGGTGGEGETAGAGSIEPGGRVKFSLFLDMFSADSASTAKVVQRTQSRPEEIVVPRTTHTEHHTHKDQSSGRCTDALSQVHNEGCCSRVD